MIIDIKNILIQHFDVNINEETDCHLRADCRHWGRWDLPDDLEEGDEEDCDNEVLVDESEEKVNQIIGKLKIDFPSCNISWMTGEKNYINFYIDKKVK